MTIGNDHGNDPIFFYSDGEGSSSDDKAPLFQRNVKRVFEEFAFDDAPDFLSRRVTKKQKTSNVNNALFPKIYPRVNEKMEIDGKVVAINGLELPIKELGKGNFHKVFEFVGEAPVSILNNEYPADSIVLKSFNPLKDPKQLLLVKDDDIAGYEFLLKEGIPQPKVYVRPDLFEDSKDPKYGDFWITERMEKLAPIGEQYVLDFVKIWLTKSADAKREIIADFYPRNVMVKAGKCYIVDPSLPDEDDDWMENLFSFVIAWSDGKQETYDYLTTSPFPQKVKAVLDEILQEKKDADDGKFPTTNQTTFGA
jgi:hypothetical protein